MKTTPFIILGSLLALVAIFFLTKISYQNKEKTKYSLYVAKQKNIENVYDATWKIISQKANISEEYRNSFDSIYTNIMQARYDKGDGTLMKWITEQNPNFDTSLYIDLANSVESLRINFMNEQTQLLDIVRDYNLFITKFPASLFFYDKELLEAKLITSTRSKEALSNGVDDDISLFKK